VLQRVSFASSSSVSSSVSRWRASQAEDTSSVKKTTQENTLKSSGMTKGFSQALNTVVDSPSKMARLNLLDPKKV
jgi:hypothetical protein